MEVLCLTGAKMFNVTVGDALIAPANMVDARFDKTVMLVTQVNNTGHMALCLNRPTEYTLQDLLDREDLSIDKKLEHPLYWGGPVNQNTVWMLHDPDWSQRNSLYINDKWSMTSHVSMFSRLSDNDYPRWFRFFFGFAAWGPGQLEHEIQGEHPWRKEHSWLIAKDIDPYWMVDQVEDLLWQEAIQLSANQAVEQWL